MNENYRLILSIVRDSTSEADPNEEVAHQELPLETLLRLTHDQTRDVIQAATALLMLQVFKPAS